MSQKNVLKVEKTNTNVKKLEDYAKEFKLDLLGLKDGYTVKVSGLCPGDKLTGEEAYEVIFHEVKDETGKVLEPRRRLPEYLFKALIRALANSGGKEITLSVAINEKDGRKYYTFH